MAVRIRALNVFEQHAGKLFLGAVLLVCLILAWLYVFGDIGTVEIAGQATTPGQLREQLDQERQRLAKGIAPGAEIRDKDKIIRPVPVDFRPGTPPPLAQARFADIAPTFIRPAPQLPPDDVKLNLPVDKLKPPQPPKLATDQGGYQNRQVIYVSASTVLPHESFRAFTDDLQEQAAKARADLGELSLVVLRLRLQRVEVNEAGQPVGQPVDVPRFTRVPETEVWKKDQPFPGADDPKLPAWIKKMTGDSPEDEKCYVRAFAKVQEQVVRPRMYDGVPWTVEDPRPPAAIAPAVEDDGLDIGPGLLPGEEAPVPPAGMPPPGQVAPQQQDFVWAIDETVESNKRYAYRISYVLLNPLLNRYLLNVRQNHQVEIQSDSLWSDWSLPVQTEQDLYYFLARPRIVLGEASVEVTVYRRAWGGWFVQTFPVNIGEPIGGPTGQAIKAVKVGIHQPDKKEYDVKFGTGAVAVDIRRGVEVMVRPPNVDPPILTAVRTVEVVLLDERGRLTVRNVEHDQAKAQRRKVLDEIAEWDKPPVAPVVPPVGGPIAPWAP